jgi:hypothetical protein
VLRLNTGYSHAVIIPARDNITIAFFSIQFDNFETSIFSRGEVLKSVTFFRHMSFVMDLKYIVDCSCRWKLSSGINVYKFPLDNFHLQEPSTIIELSEMPTKY